MCSSHVRQAPLLVALLMFSGCGGSNAPAAVSGVAGAGLPVTSLAPSHAHTRRDARAYSTKKSLLFEADETQAAVNIYLTKDLAKNPSPIASIHALYFSTECNGNDIEEYPRSSSKEKLAITGISDPSGLAIDSHQTLYVSTYPPSIEEFPYGTTTPAQTITGQGLSD